MARRRVALRGRTVAALALLGFVLIATGVIWRRAEGIAQASELRALEQERMQLEARKAKLGSEIRDAASRAQLAPIAERRLNMHVPNDTQVIILPRANPPR